MIRTCAYPKTTQNAKHSCYSGNQKKERAKVPLHSPNFTRPRPSRASLAGAIAMDVQKSSVAAVRSNWYFSAMCNWAAIACLALAPLSGCASRSHSCCESACALVGGLLLFGAAGAAENTSDPYPPDSYVPASQLSENP